MDIVSLGINPHGSSGRRYSGTSEIIGHLQILIRGIALHAIEGSPEDVRLLREQMAGIADSLSEESSPDDLLVAIGKTLRSLEEYNRRAAVVYNGQAEELRTMLTTMTSTVMFITSSSETSVKQLTSIETKLRRATTLEDTLQVKESMRECLTLVRSESLRLQAESRSKINNLKSDVERLSSRLKAVSTEDSIDPLTGLPGRVAGEEAIANKVSANRDFVTALFVVDRIVSINDRFGRHVGDDILIQAASMLAQRISGATLFRWSGPAFAAVFDPSVSTSQAETRAIHAAGMRLEKNIDADKRSVMIVVTASCHLLRVNGKTAPDAAFRSMDSFQAAQS